jgi:hypothetical protein
MSLQGPEASPHASTSSTNSDPSNRACGASGASCWSAARLGAAAVMAGLDPAIHAAPPQMSPGSAANGAGASGTKRFDLAAPLRSFSAPKNVDGRDEPGHDASGPFRAAPVFGIPRLPTTNAIRVVLYLANKQKVCYVFLFAGLIGAARRRPIEDGEEGCDRPLLF